MALPRAKVRELREHRYRRTLTRETRRARTVNLDYVEALQNKPESELTASDKRQMASKASLQQHGHNLGDRDFSPGQKHYYHKKKGRK